MIIIVLFLLFQVFNPAPSAHAVNIHYGANAPQFTLNTLGGEKVSLSDYKGSIVALIYWKTDQDYSLEAIEDCRDFFKTYKERGVQFIGLIADSEDMQKARTFVRDSGIDFPVLVDTDRRVYGSYGFRVYPTTIIIDRKGKYYRDIPGHAVTYKTKLEGYLRHMLGEIGEDELLELIAHQRKAKKKPKSERAAERKYNLALKFADAGLIDQAITSAESSLESEPDMSKTHVLLGYLYLKNKEIEKALEEFERALELDSGSYAARTGQGKAYISKGELDSAIETLTDAIAAHPNPHIAYYELGRAYELKGEKDKAIDMYRKALELTIGNSFQQLTTQSK